MSRRRGNGEGSISQRKDGSWMGRVRLPNGKRKYVYGRTRGEVSRKLTEVLTAMHEGRVVATSRLSTEQYLRTWFEGHRTRVRASTAAAYETLLRNHIYPSIGRLPLSRLEVHHHESMYALKIEEGLAPATVRQIHAIVRKALDRAAVVGTVPRNVGALAKPPRVPKHEIQPLTAAQASALLAAAAGDRLEALYVLSLTTGMRIGEVLGLRWADVELDGHHLQVRHTLRHHRSGGGWTLGEPKSARSRRRIRLSSVAILALRVHRARQAEERLALGPAWEAHDFVFANRKGTPIRANNLRRRSFAQLLEASGLPASTRLHDLRHTAATLLLLQNVHVKVVSELLGHASTSFTMDRYAHVLPPMQETAANAMDALLKGGE